MLVKAASVSFIHGDRVASIHRQQVSESRQDPVPGNELGEALIAIGEGHQGRARHDHFQKCLLPRTRPEAIEPTAKLVEQGLHWIRR